MDGLYGDNPAGIWQPVKLTISDPLKVEDVFIKPALDGAEFDITVKNSSLKGNIQYNFAEHAHMCGCLPAVYIYFSGF